MEKPVSLRRLSRRAAVAGFLTLVLVSCTAQPFEPAPPEPPIVPSASLLGDVLGGLGSTTKTITNTLAQVLQLLTCPLELPQRDSEIMGPAGGRLRVGRHQLLVPPGALDRNVRITGILVGDGTASVVFQPEGLRFRIPARLELDYRPCTLVRSPKRVVYTTDDGGTVLEVLPSRDDPESRTVEGRLDHFSRYAVAW